MFVSKKTGDWRMVIDYRNVNRQMTADSYPLPLLWELVTKATGKQIYTSLDLASGFWNCPIAEESMQYTSFICSKGQFEFTVLPFGIRNCPAELQRAVDMAFNELYDTGKVSCYLDDIVLATNEVNEHYELLEAVLKRCCECGLFLRLDKCVFLQQQIQYLGFIISALGIKPNPKRIEALLSAKTPTNIHELRCLLGALSYLRMFLPDFSTRSACLSNMTSKKARFEWKDEHETTLRSIINDMADFILLAAPCGHTY